MLEGVDPNAHDRFFLRQRIRLVINQYEFSLPLEDGTPSMPFCFVEQRRFTFKEDIRFYANESKEAELFRVKARQWFDPAARYDVVEEGTRIGQIQKLFGRSLLRSTYVLYDAEGGEIARAREVSLSAALIRRGIVFVPMIDWIADWVPIPYHFEIRRRDTVLGTHRRQLFRLRDVYTIDMSGDPARTVDRRLVLALAVCMDALQAR